MKQSLRGPALPECKEDYELLLGLDLLEFKACHICHKPHLGRTRTPAGWRETQISGSCEDCWDEMFKGMEEEDDNKS